MTKTELKTIRMALRYKHAAMANEKITVDPDQQREVRAALRRIGKGTYGICIDCGESIDPNRLAAAPWAAYCVPCQEATDSERAAPARWFDAAVFIAA